MNNNEFIIYSVKTTNFGIDNFKDFLKDNKLIYNNINDIVNEIENNDNYYYFRINKKNEYILFGDIDHFDNTFDIFIKKFINFMEEFYNIIINEDDFSYTENDYKKGSFHYSIPKYHGSIKKIKEIHQNFLKIYKNDFIKKINKKLINMIDTSIYSDHWFRCPNQSKTLNDNSKHLIIKGNMKDFIIDYIPEYSVNINKYKYNNIETEEKEEKEEIININEENQIINNSININNLNEIDNKYDNELMLNINREDTLALTNTIYHCNTYKEIFDKCYAQERFEIYEYWLSVGMSIKNTIFDENKALDLFNYFSSKGSNYAGEEITSDKYSTLIKKNYDQGYGIATIYYYAIIDNKTKFVEIMSRNKIQLGQTDICRYIHVLAGRRFIYKKDMDTYKLYCYDNKFWQEDYIIFRIFISKDLYHFLSDLITSLYCDENLIKSNKNLIKEYTNLKSKLEKLKSISYKKELQETYKEYGLNNDIIFNDKWNIFAFNNIVYDLEKSEFREHRYDDYISITTGYDWVEPLEDDIKYINDLIKIIMPIEVERELFLQILATGLDGKCLEKFIIFNGSGGNGKGVLNDLLLKAVGSYGIIANNSILFETNKTGSNPEKANLHKKRLVIMREPSEKNKFENSVMKELTGGGLFSARTHNEKTTEKELNLTLIVECNKKPNFSEEPKESESRRIIDIFFRSTFTTDKDLIDETNNIYAANSYLKTSEFQNKYKCALLKILFEVYKKYKDNNYILIIPETIKERTNVYLQSSCFLLEWFKDNYILTNDKKIYTKISDIYENYKTSENYLLLSNREKRKYNNRFFVEYFKNNLFIKKYYKERDSKNRNFLIGWIKKEMNESDSDSDTNTKL